MYDQLPLYLVSEMHKVKICADVPSHLCCSNGTLMTQQQSPSRSSTSPLRATCRRQHSTCPLPWPTSTRGQPQMALLSSRSWSAPSLQQSLGWASPAGSCLMVASLAAAPVWRTGVSCCLLLALLRCPLSGEDSQHHPPCHDLADTLAIDTCGTTDN